MQKPIYYTADWHVGHEAVIDFDSRPFSSLEHMHRVLANNFNSTVPSNGITYVLGDAGLCCSSMLREFLRTLNGTKVLIVGNHDKGVNAAYGIGFDAVLHGAVFTIANQRVTASHCPLLGVPRENIEGMRGATAGEAWHKESRHARFAMPNAGQFHLHGHIHSPNNGRSKRICGRQFDVGVVANRYRPVSITEIESWIRTTLKREEG